MSPFSIICYLYFYMPIPYPFEMKTQYKSIPKQMVHVLNSPLTN